MTLAQLKSFVLVARLGSVKAAAAELVVTEPAVSVAVAALRKELLAGIQPAKLESATELLEQLQGMFDAGP